MPIVFLGKETVPRVLGRAGIFEHFILIFEEKQRRIGFIEEGATDAPIIQKILNEIQ